MFEEKRFGFHPIQVKIPERSVKKSKWVSYRNELKEVGEVSLEEKPTEKVDEVFRKIIESITTTIGKVVQKIK